MFSAAPALAFTACVMAAAVSGCGGTDRTESAAPARTDAAPPAQSAPAPQPSAPVSPARAWTKEALEVQPQMDLLRQRVPADLGYKPANTPWTASTTPLPTTRAESPGELLASVTLAQGWVDPLGDAVWEQTMRILVDDANPGSATGVVLQWGFMDDAIAGRDFRVQMRMTGGMWQVERIDERYHCSRAVSPEGRCS
jgi:hypothetical protein